MAKKPSKAKAVNIADKSVDQTDHQAGKGTEIAGIGTSLIVSEIVLRSIGRLIRHSLEKAVARRRYGSDKAKAIVEDRGILHTAAAYGVTKLATRSVPGALLVGGGLLAKTLYDRGTAKRKPRRLSKRPPAAKTED
jgi:hypothetical protein